jgi:hypothetical protein
MENYAQAHDAKRVLRHPDQRDAKLTEALT